MAVAVGVEGAANVLNVNVYGEGEGVPPASVDIIDTVFDTPEPNPVN